MQGPAYGHVAIAGHEDHRPDGAQLTDVDERPDVDLEIGEDGSELVQMAAMDHHGRIDLDECRTGQEEVIHDRQRFQQVRRHVVLGVLVQNREGQGVADQADPADESEDGTVEEEEEEAVRTWNAAVGSVRNSRVAPPTFVFGGSVCDSRIDQSAVGNINSCRVIAERKKR